MYQPPHFVETRPEVLHRLVQEHPFGLLVTRSRGRAEGEDDRLAADGIPFLLDADPAGGPGLLRGHVARANPLWRDGRGDVDSLVVFQGPQGYVSPGWYASKAEHGKVVPTWNYIMVQGRGRLVAIEDAAWLHALVSRLTDTQEGRRPAPWAVTDAPAPFVDSMLKAIVGIEIALTSLEGKWKVSQNRSAADRAGVAHGFAAEATADGAALAAALRDTGGAP